MVFGAFGETDKTTQALIKQCVKYAAARSENSNHSPMNSEGREGIFQVMLSQYRRAIGVMATRTAAEIRIRTCGFIRSSIDEADAVKQPDMHRYHNNYTYNSWYKNRENEDQFREFWAYHSQHNSFYTI